jgi:hypothetical protein
MYTNINNHETEENSQESINAKVSQYGLSVEEQAVKDTILTADEALEATLNEGDL